VKQDGAGIKPVTVEEKKLRRTWRRPKGESNNPAGKSGVRRMRPGRDNALEG
jgi:hypothetical protein